MLSRATQAQVSNRQIIVEEPYLRQYYMTRSKFLQMRTSQGRGCICSVASEDRGEEVLLELPNSKQSIATRSFKFGMFNYNRDFGKNHVPCKVPAKLCWRRFHPSRGGVRRWRGGPTVHAG